MNPTVLPELSWIPTTACGDRHLARVQRVVVHRWGDPATTEQAEQATYHGVIGYFQNPAHQASAHFVYPGSAEPGHCTQMVRLADYAWTEAAYNPTSVEIESADLIWTGDDGLGLEQLARIVGWLLHHYGLSPLWSVDHGFCRHADLGAAGGGHTQCPTTDLAAWRYFAGRVAYQYHAGGYRKTWAR